jgi:hypothetical protein
MQAEKEMIKGRTSGQNTPHKEAVLLKKTSITKRYSAVDAMMMAVASRKSLEEKRNNLSPVAEREMRESIVSMPDPDTEDLLP